MANISISQLLTRGNIKAAINLLKDDEERISLLGRYNRLEKDNRLGILTQSEYSRGINQITHAVLSISSEGAEVNNSYLPKQSESSLLEVHKLHRRRHPAFAKTVMELINEFQQYNLFKSAKTAYDPSQRRFNLLKQKEQNILKKSREFELNYKESKTSKVLSLISEGVPSYKDLSQAWALCQGLGMKSSWIPTSLTNQPNDDEVRISIAEEIEAFVELI